MHTVKHAWITAVFLVFLASAGFAEDFLSVSGKVNLRGVVPLNKDSEKEYPSLLGKIRVDTTHPAWRFHLWLEGGWDGSVDLPARNHSVVKVWDKVYQSITPFLEFKELYGAYSNDVLEIRAGIQRFSWGRLDEYPVNDLLNPWDYTQVARKSLEDKKIGIPSLSVRLAEEHFNMELVWAPLLVPYRLPLPTERWSGFTEIAPSADRHRVEILTREPDLPPRTLENGSIGLRLSGTGAVDWGVTLFHGYDPRPVFKATELVISQVSDKILVDPGGVPDFHKMSSIGIDAATDKGNVSLRAEAAYAVGRYFNTKSELWGYPSGFAFGVHKLNPVEHKSDSMEYGIGVDYRLFEDCILTMQAQQALIVDRPDTLYDRKFETVIWANLKNGFLNQKVETNLNLVYNPEHGSAMARADAWYAFTDAWKAGVTAAAFRGPAESLFGRYSKNNQVELEIIFSY
ncbi:MAG: hypothetical protein JW943_12075 [Deltaproteobacteria bacterium]|nr:hypothetical protein [Deltaproteobacteria bacterium]